MTRGSLIRVQEKVYSVSTNLIGRRVTVRIHVWHLEVYYYADLISAQCRLVGNKLHRVSYHHLIDSLLYEPVGSGDYRYRENLLPSLIFRQAWERFSPWQSSPRADLANLRILRLASRKMESAVIWALG